MNCLRFLFIYLFTEISSPTIINFRQVKLIDSGSLKGKRDQSQRLDCGLIEEPTLYP